MMNYDKLPNEINRRTVEPGTYFAIIVKGEIRESRNNYTPYLNVQYYLFDENNIFKGSMFDIFTESTKEIPMYKLKRFIDAIELKISGEFDLEYLSSKIVGKSLIVDTKLRKDYDPPNLEVDVFKGQVYYPLSESFKIFNVEAPKLNSDENLKNDGFDGVPLIEDDLPF